MKRQELVFRFHNPNNEKDTYNALVKIFTDVGCRKLMEVISNIEADQAESKEQDKK